MADNRKYYYLKLKESYFDDDAIVLLESMQDGVIYSNILLKLYLKSLPRGGAHARGAAGFAGTKSPAADRGGQMSTISSGHLSTRDRDRERDRYRNRKRERVRNGTPRPRRLWQIPQCHSFRYGA